jgi:hypothetical protein
VHAGGGVEEHERAGGGEPRRVPPAVSDGECDADEGDESQDADRDPEVAGLGGEAGDRDPERAVGRGRVPPDFRDVAEPGAGPVGDPVLVRAEPVREQVALAGVGVGVAAEQRWDGEQGQRPEGGGDEQPPLAGDVTELEPRESEDGDADQADRAGTGEGHAEGTGEA